MGCRERDSTRLFLQTGQAGGQPGAGSALGWPSEAPALMCAHCTTQSPRANISGFQPWTRGQPALGVGPELQEAGFLALRT